MIVNLADIIEDVADRLGISDGGCIDDKVNKKILKGIKRLFDRFSIDGRMIPIVQQVEDCLDVNCNRVAIGPEGDFKAIVSPHRILYAAWAHRPDCGCDQYDCCQDHVKMTNVTCDQRIVINDAVDHFHMTNACRDEIALPTEMWFQQSSPNGEIVFNTIPPKGSTLILRAEMPFCIDLGKCGTKCEVGEELPEWEIILKPDCDLPTSVRHSIMDEFYSVWDGCDPDFTLCTTAETCSDCPGETKVIAQARKLTKKEHGCIRTGEINLPPGYYDAIVSFLTYDMAPYAPMERTADMRMEMNDAKRLLFRANERQEFGEPDMTVPWNNKCGVGQIMSITDGCKSCG